ncbi:MAG: sulfite exporter TauE/SafE family protein [Methyloligella sp. ZOD6]
MTADLATGELITLVIALLSGGVLTGFLAGLLGIGGGGILVPVLFELFTVLGVQDEVRMPMVLGTSFAVIVPTAVRSFLSHKKRDAVDRDVLIRLAPFVLGGVLAGIALVSIVSGEALKWVWIVFGAAVGIKMLLGREDWRIGDVLPDNGIVRLVAFAIGLVSTLMSIGGGMFFVTLFVLFGWSMQRAVATSSGFGPLIAIPGLIGYIWAGWGDPDLPAYSLGYVNVAAALVIIPVSVAAAPLGVRLAHGISRRKLELAFAIFLILVSARLLISALH